jgi:hypothetical protein
MLSLARATNYVRSTQKTVPEEYIQRIPLCVPPGSKSAFSLYILPFSSLPQILSVVSHRLHKCLLVKLVNSITIP